MSDITTAFWGMVINNYDETDLALVQQGYPDHVRKIVYTLERGESGTPHIQAYVRLFRQQRLSYVKKLFPRGNFKALTSDEYKLNAERYAQKQDKTAESPSVIINNPFPDPVKELVSVIEEAFSSPDCNEYYHHRPHIWAEAQPRKSTLLDWLAKIEFRRVRKTPSLAKFYVSPLYRKVKAEYLDALKAHVFDLHKVEDTHTHTHTDEKFSHAEDITNGSGEDDEEFEEFESEGEDDEGDEDSESEASEGYDESGSVSSGSSDVSD